MRYGGHQTFTIREGWLYKGLNFLMSEKDSEKLIHKNAADYLGVGRNMAKSINHWLLATGLAEKKKVPGKSKKMITTKNLIPTDLAKMVWKNDPYFLDRGTWWIIHANLVNSPNEAATWNWFFNNFHLDRFQKQVCLQALIRNESMKSSRNPSNTTLDRDLSCFLNSYSKEIPSKKKDPEDEIESPLVELNLMNYYRQSGYYQIRREKKDINLFTFLYSLALAHKSNDMVPDNETLEIPFFDLVNLKNGPGKIFALNNEDLFELLLSFEKQYEGKYLELLGLAGDRLVKTMNKPSMTWAKTYYISGIDQ
ncbi:DUF4007 family protein [Candidatus Peregrinibacteria bacterium]|nr:DUF4007 family protein [Candidatus Peregrinibacteria bacterium]